ncbi:MAG: Hydroxymethylpyrimidine/phosphomethylpyrimidine kinase [Syntrophaceae bacterium PtaB.Bin038]|nr:MAG: Hydroxymethylpyrimidine/phosphomethylpyrimidine kinase [Syntrophaceae bacterium PtaB.Bin038]
MEAKRVLTIAGSDSGGGAGIQADLKTITALGGFGMSVVTALTAQNTLGVQGVYDIPVEFIEAQFDSVAGDIGVDAAKTGMLSSTAIIRCVAKKIRQYRIRRLVVDPVMVAKGGSPLLREEARGTLIRDLIPLAAVVTPNIPEAEVLTGMRITKKDHMKKAALLIRKLGAKNVVVKGGHLEGDAADLLFDGKSFHEFAAKRIDTKHTHGTGCTFASAVATGLAQGFGVLEAVGRAKEYVTEAIRFGFAIGGGRGPTNHFAPVIREAERWRCIEELRKAVARLKGGRTGNIVPEIQSNFGYALPGASSAAEVAAVPGRIIRVGENVETLHDPAFGASSHVAKVILAVMRFDGRYRSAMNIRFSEEIVEILKDLGFDVASFDRAHEPREVKLREGSSLEWGTTDALSRHSGIPDAVFDRGGDGKEPIVRILGRDPAEVAGKVLKVSKALRR